MHRRLLPPLCLALLLVLPGLAAAQRLRIAAAVSLADAFTAIGERFEAGHPGVKLSFEFAATGQLLQRAASGEDFDLLATADEDSMGRALPLLRDGAWQVFAGNALVLVVPAGSDRVSAPEDLRLLQRVGIGEPTSVPVGRYAREALQRFGLWASLQPRLRLAGDARQLLDWVAGGEVDAALVYRSDALQRAGSLRVVTELGGHAEIRYPIAVLRRSGQSGLAMQFSAFLRGAEARAILRRKGFSVGAPA